MSDLRYDYNATSDRLKAALERLRFYAQSAGLGAGAIGEIDRVLARARNNTFVVAVVGEFNRGKSTFINALLGRPILPADALPATATVNRVRYGPRPTARIVYKATEDEPERTEPVDVDRLREYVTKLDDDGERASQIKQAEVFFPLPFLEQNEIIDTPGLNDEISMTDVTYGILPEADAAIMLVVPQAPFGQTEEEFLNHLLNQDIGRVMFVINRIDQVRRPADRDRAIAGIRERIESSTRRRAETIYAGDPEALARYQRRIGTIQVFGLSAREALEARIHDDAARLEASGFPPFEAALRQFLEQGRGAARLKILANRVVLSGQQVAQALAVRLGALQLTQEDFNTTYQQSVEQLNTMNERLRTQIARIDITAAEVHRIATDQIAGLADHLKQVAAQVVTDAPMTDADLEQAALRIYSRNLRQQVLTTLQDAGRDIADRMQHIIEVKVEGERERLAALAEIVGGELTDITQQFFRADLAAGSPASFASLIGNRNRMIGVGAIIGVAALFTPLAPVVLAVALVGALGGNWLSRTVGGGGQGQIKRFKQKTIETICDDIDKQVASRSSDIREQFERHVAETFAVLKQQAQIEIGGPIEQLRRTVDELRIERERGQVRAEHARSESELQEQEIAALVADARAIALALDEEAS